MITNQRTVTIKMTRGEALLLRRLLNNLNDFFLKTNDENDFNAARKVCADIRAAVDKLDQEEKV